MEHKGHSIRFSEGRDSRGAFFVPVIDGESTMGESQRSSDGALRRGKQIIDEREIGAAVKCPKCEKKGPIWFNFLETDESGQHGQYICRECDIVVKEI